MARVKGEVVGYGGGWNAEQVELLKTLWVKGEGVNRIAVACGKLPKQIYSKREKLGLKPREDRRPKEVQWEPGQLARFKSLYLKGIALERIAEEMEIGVTTIKKMRRRLGLDVRKRGGTKMIHTYVPLAMYDKIGRAARLDKVTVSQYIRTSLQMRL